MSPKLNEHPMNGQSAPPKLAHLKILEHSLLIPQIHQKPKLNEAMV
ncbi:hypothetical protein WZ342_2287 [Enterococcus faecalis]|nr:hypothetical protein WZ342_2287 [Enterococcus faecalis]